MKSGPYESRTSDLTVVSTRSTDWTNGSFDTNVGQINIFMQWMYAKYLKRESNLNKKLNLVRVEGSNGFMRDAWSGKNRCVTRESSQRINVIRDYLNACDARLISLVLRKTWIIRENSNCFDREYYTVSTSVTANNFVSYFYSSLPFDVYIVLDLSNIEHDRFRVAATVTATAATKRLIKHFPNKLDCLLHIWNAHWRSRAKAFPWNTL